MFTMIVPFCINFIKNIYLYSINSSLNMEFSKKNGIQIDQVETATMVKGHSSIYRFLPFYIASTLNVIKLSSKKKNAFLLLSTPNTQHTNAIAPQDMGGITSASGATPPPSTTPIDLHIILVEMLILINTYRLFF